MDKLLTVSVAAYNVSSYLPKLISSVTDADVTDHIEVLIINDGSTDDTAAIANDFEKRFPSAIRVIHQENGGHGSTVNRGIREANGKYFRALDGDDWLHSASLRKLVMRLADLDADLIVAPYCECHEGGEETVVSRFSALEKERVYPLEEVVKRVPWMSFHTLIYKTALLREHDIRLDENCFYEDTEYALYPLPHVNTVYCFGDHLYCYRTGLSGQSVSVEGRVRHIDDGWLVTEHLLDFLNREKERLSPACVSYMVRGIAGQCCFHLQSMLLLPKGAEALQMIRRFDGMVAAKSPAVYSEMASRVKAFRILRATGYLAYGMVRRHRNREFQ
ncbi:MAG: glycosyltransferase [Lachnospiraceae bacterium]|nr:glycosyltransferase [Lachnospiraceae bacterium]